MQKVPALLKVRQKQDEKNPAGNAIKANSKKIGKICALLLPKSEVGVLYTNVEHEKSGQV